MRGRTYPAWNTKVDEGPLFGLIGKPERPRRPHPHSAKALGEHADSGRLSKRCEAILAVLEAAAGRMTDRQIKIIMGFEDMNSVRPRITEMIRDGILVEVGETVCPVTKMTVRTVIVKGSD